MLWLSTNLFEKWANLRLKVLAITNCFLFLYKLTPHLLFARLTAMITIKIILGILLLALGWVYFFKSNLVLTLNKIVRETLFNDRIILLERKKLAILFFCLSFVTLYMGFSSLVNLLGSQGKNSWLMETSSYMMYMAMQDYCSEKYGSAIQKYVQVLKADPNNMTALKRLSYTYEASGDTAKARVIWQKILSLNPKNKEIMEKLKIKTNENKRKN